MLHPCYWSLILRSCFAMYRFKTEKLKWCKCCIQCVKTHISGLYFLKPDTLKCSLVFSYFVNNGALNDRAQPCGNCDAKTSKIQLSCFFTASYLFLTTRHFRVCSQLISVATNFAGNIPIKAVILTSPPERTSAKLRNYLYEDVLEIMYNYRLKNSRNNTV